MQNYTVTSRRLPTSTANLGVYIDEQLSMELNARQCAKTCYFHIRRIRQLSRLVDRDTLHTLVRSLVLGRLDYCNGLLAGCTSSTLHRLHRVHCAGRRCQIGLRRSSPCSRMSTAATTTLVADRQSHPIQTVYLDVRRST